MNAKEPNSNPTEQSHEGKQMAPLAPHKILTIDVLASLRIEYCNSCGKFYAVDNQTFLLRLSENGHIYCGNCGELNELKTDYKGGEEFISEIFRLNAELQRQRHANEILRKTMMVSAANAENDMGDLDELHRRIRMIASTAPIASNSKPMCRFCGATSGRHDSLRRHLRHYHSDEIAKLPAEVFAL